MCGELGLSQDSGDATEVLAPFCKRYGCEECVPIMRRRIQRAIREGRPNKFLTLTDAGDRTGDPIEAAGRLMHCWDIFLKWMRRYKGGRLISFLHLKEGHKDGWPHLHIVLRMKSIDHEILREQWFRISGAFEIRIEAVRNQRRLAKYLSKYITKDLVKFGKYRVWSCSRDWVVAPEEQPTRPVADSCGRMTVIKGNVRSHLAMLERSGYLIVTMGLRSWRYYAPHDWPQWAYEERIRKRANTTGHEERFTWHF